MSTISPVYLSVLLWKGKTRELRMSTRRNTAKHTGRSGGLPIPSCRDSPASESPSSWHFQTLKLLDHKLTSNTKSTNGQMLEESSVTVLSSDLQASFRQICAISHDCSSPRPSSVGVKCEFKEHSEAQIPTWSAVR